MARKKKVEELRQTDGRWTDEQRREIDEIMGNRNNGYGKFPTMEAYKAHLDEMNLADLHREAVARGLLPNDDRRRLVDNLTRQFKKTTNPYKGVYSREDAWTPKDKKQIAELME